MEKIRNFARVISAAAVGVAATVAFAAPASAQAVAGDAARGSKLYLQCRACHTIDAGGKHTVGPNLNGVFGKKAATTEGYKYSPALQNAGLTWDEKTLDTFLTRPSALVKGNKMAFGGLANPKARADIIAYLKSQSGAKKGK